MELRYSLLRRSILALFHMKVCFSKFCFRCQIFSVCNMAADLQEGMESRDDPAKQIFCFNTFWFGEGYKECQISSLADQCFRKNIS